MNYTLLFAGSCALLQCLLTVLVIARRTQTGVSLLDGGDAQLLQRIRAHGNFVETAPMALLLMALLEWKGFYPAAIIGFGSLLIIGRILHAYDLIQGRAFWPRISGIVMSLVVISFEALCCLWVFASI
jgi:uncharacterized protein